MKKVSTIKPRCKDCKTIKRKGLLYIYCLNPKHKQRQGSRDKRVA